VNRQFQAPAVLLLVLIPLELVMP